MGIGELGGGLDLLTGGVEISVADIFGNRVVKKEGLLSDGADVATQGMLGDLAHIASIDFHHA